MFGPNVMGRVVALLLALVLLTACGGGSGSQPASTPSPAAAGNVLGVIVDAGPSGAGYNVNRLYTTVKVCQPDGGLCKVIDHVLVDTGSTGLRLLSSALGSSVGLPRILGKAGLPLLNCAQFVDATYAWGPVVTSDLILGGQAALLVPIQIIADREFDTAPGSCAAGGTAITDVKSLGANGILGLGLFKEDCGSGCGSNVHNGFYYTCTDPSCAATTGAIAALSQQVRNPVSSFASDNNGVVIELPPVGAAGLSNLTGSLIFGVGTQSNNQMAPGSVVLFGDAWGYVSTLLGGTNQPNNFARSFFDTGSNGLFFDSATIQLCAQSQDFYCPASTLALSATLVGANAAKASVGLAISDATPLFTDGSKSAFPGLAGPIGESSIFDFGLPFFYGRRVAIGLAGRSSSLGTGPYYAF